VTILCNIPAALVGCFALQIQRVTARTNSPDKIWPSSPERSTNVPDMNIHSSRLDIHARRAIRQRRFTGHRLKVKYGWVRRAASFAGCAFLIKERMISRATMHAWGYWRRGAVAEREADRDYRDDRSSDLSASIRGATTALAAIAAASSSRLSIASTIAAWASRPGSGRSSCSSAESVLRRTILAK